MTRIISDDELIRIYAEPGHGYTDQALGERFGVGRDAIFKRRKKLMDEYGDDFFMETERGRYRIDSETFVSNIKVSWEEALILYLATRRLSRNTRLPKRAVTNALSKLATALYKPMTERLVKAASNVPEHPDEEKRANMLTTLIRGWTEQLKVHIRYRSLKSTESAKYTICPYLIEPSPWSDSVYVVAQTDIWDNPTPFQLERIEKAVLSTEPFIVDPKFQEETLFQYTWGIWYSDREPQMVKLKFTGREAVRRLQESVWHPDQKISEPDEHGHVIWTAPISEPREMLPWIRGWGADCEVLEPPNLRRALEREARRLAELYGVARDNTPQTRFFAHRREGEDREDWQPLIEHLQKTAEMAHDFGQNANVAELAYIAGRLHDLGKYSAEFQRRLEGGPRVDHSTAGAKEFKQLLKGTPQEAFAQLLAYPIMGHHTGLPDYGNETDLEGGTICARLKNNLPDYSAYKSELDLSALPFPRYWHIRPPEKKKEKLGFSLSFLTRMVYSALVDADFQETETYMQGPKRRGEHDDIPTLREKLDAHLKQFENPISDINRKRNETLQACIERGKSEAPGFFSLTVPTGGGKTLASMAFALHHAAKHGLKRIIYVIPFTTIIEQNARVFKDIFGEENVLEHHSNFDWTGKKRENPDDRTNSVLAKLKLAAENWDIPIVVTTNVQFFESLFANKSSRCRKLHNIAKSVIIFDEAQMLPREYMRPAMAAVWELATNYGASAVFCTATQPGLERFFPEETKPTELAPNPPALFDFFKRVEIKHLGTLTDEALLARLKVHEQVLCIINTRRHASGLFSGLQGDEGNYHLSTLMCPAHRRAKVAEIKERLQKQQPCRVVSTTVMEAGIDLDFPVGYRALAGLDSINQAAGRINREMKRGVSEMFIFEPKTAFIKKTPSFLKQSAEVTRMVLRDHAAAPISIPAIEAFFRRLYDLQDPNISFDFKRIMECFDSEDGRFKFETAAREFQIIEDPTVTVIIPYNKEAERLIEDLQHVQYPSKTLRGLQPYTVSIFEGEFDKLSSKGVILTIDDKYHYLNPSHFKQYYDPHRGLLVPESVGGDGLFF